MASTVLRGSGDINYVNNTGQNVRIVINYLRKATSSGANMTISWGGATTAQRGSLTTTLNVIGRNLAYYFTGGGTTAAGTGGGAGSFTIESGINASNSTANSAPTELMLAPGDTFIVTGYDTSARVAAPVSAYNIVVIPEAG